MTTRLLLVRHAEAVCNVEDRWAGHDTCAGLSVRGRLQSELIGHRLRDLVGAADVVMVTSVLRRAVETARLVAQALDHPGDVLSTCELCERHPGTLEGLSRAAVAAVLATGSATTGTCEGIEAFHLRARRVLRSLAGTYPERTVVAVTHGGIIARSFWALGGLPARLPFRVEPTNGSVTEWVLQGRDGWTLRRYNDTGCRTGAGWTPEKGESTRVRTAGRPASGGPR